MSDSDVLEWRITQLEEDRKRLADAIESLVRLEESYQVTLKAVEEKHATVNQIDRRVRALENAMPMLEKTSQWVIMAALGILSLVGMNVYKLLEK